MKTLSTFIENLNIVKFSRLNAFILLFFILLSIFAQTYFFYKIEDLNKKKQIIESSYDILYKFEYSTQQLLTSYSIENSKNELEKTFKEYKKSFKTLDANIKLSDAILNYDAIVSSKYKKLIFFIEKNYFFDKKNLMDKPILVRLGEINRSEEKNNHFLSIKSFFQKVEHIKQYQTFLLEDISELRKNVIDNANQEIESLNTLFITIPILLLIIATLLSLIIDKAIIKKEKTLVTTKNLLENIINSIPIRVFWKDKDSRYLGTNKEFLNDIGLASMDDLIGKNDFELPWKDTEAKNYIQDDKFVMETKSSKLNIVETQKRQDGSIAYLNTSKVPLRNEKNEVIGLLGIYEDITLKKEIEKKLKAQEAQIIQQDRLAQMGEMIAMIAHQWRQPLTIISTIVGALHIKNIKDKYDKELFENKFEKILTQVEYLSHTINDFSNFFKPDKQKVHISSKKVIEDTINIIEPYLSKNNITLQLEYVCQKSLYTYSNELKQVLLNILKNSQDAFMEKNIKNPTIKISANCVNESKCTIMIEDNAGGIPKDIIQKIFDPYFSTKLDKNGTGLGLYMSKTIIEEHCDGKIWVESKGENTKFFIKV